MSSSKGNGMKIFTLIIAIIFSVILFLAISLILVYYLDIGNFRTTANAFIENIYKDNFEETGEDKELQSLKWQLDKLKSKEEQILQLEDAIKKREIDLLDKEEELDGLIEENEILKKNLTSQLENLNEVVKLYETMEPQNAARLLEEAEIDFAAYIVKNMNRDTAAEVLSLISTKKAADIIDEMTRAD